MCFKISVCLLGILYSHFVKKGCPGFENFMAEVPSLLNELKPTALFRLLIDFNTITSGEENRNHFKLRVFQKKKLQCVPTVVKVHSAILPQEG